MSTETTDAEHWRVAVDGDGESFAAVFTPARKSGGVQFAVGRATC